MSVKNVRFAVCEFRAHTLQKVSVCGSARTHLAHTFTKQGKPQVTAVKVCAKKFAHVPHRVYEQVCALCSLPTGSTHLRTTHTQPPWMGKKWSAPHTEPAAARAALHAARKDTT
jgi:hypothetical protein